MGIQKHTTIMQKLFNLLKAIHALDWLTEELLRHRLYNFLFLSTGQFLTILFVLFGSFVVSSVTHLSGYFLVLVPEKQK